MVDQFPKDLWAKVFSLLIQPKMPASSADRVYAPIGSAEPDFQRDCKALATFRQLASVCNMFRTVLDEHAELTSRVVIDERLASKRNYMAWLQKRAAQIYTLEACCSSAQLESSMTALALSTSLTTCSLSNRYNSVEVPMDLTPLSGMMALKSLSLHGNFHNLSVAGHLTHLSLCDVHNQDFSQCNFCNTLLHLQFTDSNMAFHSRGLCACTTLQRLDIVQRVSERCSLMALERADRFEHNNESLPHCCTHIPNNISQLVQLTSLQLHLPGWGQDFDLDVICVLSALQNLDIVAPGTMHVSHDFENLSRLSGLSLCVRLDELALEEGGVSARYHHTWFSLDWRALKALHVLSIGGFLCVDAGFSKLAQLKNLAEIALVDAHCFELEEKRPDVAVCRPSPSTNFWPACECLLCGLQSDEEVIDGNSAASFQMLTPYVSG